VFWRRDDLARRADRRLSATVFTSLSRLGGGPISRVENGFVRPKNGFDMGSFCSYSIGQALYFQQLGGFVFAF